MNIFQNITSKSQILDLDFISELNSIIFNLSDSNYEETKNQILNSDLIKSKESLYKLLQTIDIAAFYRSKQIQLYQNLIIILSDSIKQIFGENFTLKCIITNNYLRLSLINECNFSLSNFISENVYDHKQNLHFISFFAPEIKKKGMEKVIQYYELEKYCTEQFIKERSEGLNPESLAHTIIFDDIDKFQEICSQNNINYNSVIKHSFLDSNTFIENSDLSLIEYAAYYGSLQIFKFLFMNSVRFPSDLPLYAIAGGNYEIIHILEKKQEVKFNQKSLETAVLFHRNELVEYLRENYNLNCNNIECVNKSILSRNAEFFKNNFIESNSDNKITFKGNEASELIKKIFENKSVEFLNAFAIKFKNEPNYIRSISAYFYIALKMGDFFTLEYLIHGNFYTPSMINGEIENAFKKGYIYIIDLILKETNESINYFFFQNWSTLHYAAKYNNKDLIKYALSKKDVDVNIKNNQNKTPLHIATIDDNLEAVQFLCESKVIDFNAQDNDGVDYLFVLISLQFITLLKKVILILFNYLVLSQIVIVILSQNMEFHIFFFFLISLQFLMLLLTIISKLLNTCVKVQDLIQITKENQFLN